MSLRRFLSSRYLSLAAGLVVVLGGAALPVCTGQAAPPETVSASRGKTLFAGAEPLVGRIREHQESLPSTVVSCSNCHAAHGEPAVAGSDAPVLAADLLLARRSRRHGPPSAYDDRSFCRVLRTSIDPVYVMLDHVMPVYVLSDAACASLWHFLTEPEISAGASAMPHP